MDLGTTEFIDLREIAHRDLPSLSIKSQTSPPVVAKSICFTLRFPALIRSEQSPLAVATRRRHIQIEFALSTGIGDGDAIRHSTYIQ